MTHIQRVFIPQGASMSSRNIIMAAAEDAYKRLILPLMCRLIRFNNIYVKHRVGSIEILLKNVVILDECITKL